MTKEFQVWEYPLVMKGRLGVGTPAQAHGADGDGGSHD